MTRAPAPPMTRVRNRAWVRLDSGLVSGPFWYAKDFESPVSRLLIVTVTRLSSLRAELVTNGRRSLPWIGGHVLQSLAFNTWCSCSNYLFAQNSRILFLRLKGEMNWQAIIHHIAFALLLFIRDLVTFPTLFPSQLISLGFIDCMLL